MDASVVSRGPRRIARGKEEGRLVRDSNYVTQMRRLISAARYHQGTLTPKFVKYLGYDKNPPPIEWTRLTKVGDYFYEDGTPVRGDDERAVEQSAALEE